MSAPHAVRATEESTFSAGTCIYKLTVRPRRRDRELMGLRKNFMSWYDSCG